MTCLQWIIRTTKREGGAYDDVKACRIRAIARTADIELDRRATVDQRTGRQTRQERERRNTSG